MKNIEIIETTKLVDYDYALTFMEKRISLVKSGDSNELIWFLEHPSIYTTGRGNYIKKKFINNVPLYNTGRGGKITWHGPGQRIIYFIINLKKRELDIRKFVTNVENFIILSLKELNISAYKKEKLIGIWTLDKNKKEAKISSMGLRVSKGIIYHGVSLNVSCDLNPFYDIEPCGIKGSRVTSIDQLKKTINTKVIDSVLKKNLKLLFI